MKSRILSKTLYTGVIITIVFFQFSCKTTYKLGNVEAKPINDHKLYKRMVDSSLNYSSFYVKKFSASYNLNGAEHNFKGTIKIQKDSIIWVSINAPVGGIEIARIMITPDSLKLINRLKKTFFINDFNFLNRELNVDLDFTILQSILTNSVFELSRDDDRPFIRNFRSKVLDNKYVFTSIKDKKINRKIRKNKIDRLNELNYQRFEIDPSLFRITNITVKQFEKSKSFSIKYSDFMNFNEQKFPSKFEFKAQNSEHSLSCKIKFNKISYNQNLKFSFSISDKYQRVYH